MAIKCIISARMLSTRPVSPLSFTLHSVTANAVLQKVVMVKYCTLYGGNVASRNHRPVRLSYFPRSLVEIY